MAPRATNRRWQQSCSRILLKIKEKIERDIKLTIKPSAPVTSFGA
jgi:hypothetical protein